MSEPKSIARKVHEVVPGVLRWRVSDDRIGGGESDSHAVRDGLRATLIDPLRLVERRDERE